jgi:predicted DNA-binding transcriptional regulator AlpA
MALQESGALVLDEIKRQIAVLEQIGTLIAIRERVEHLREIEAALALAQEARQAESEALQILMAIRNEEDLIDERAAMKRLAISESTIKRMRADGSLPFVRVGVAEKLVRYRPSDIAAMQVCGSIPRGQ